MRTETLKDNRALTRALLPSVPPSEEGTYRKLAIEQLELVRRFKIHVAGFVLAMVIATPAWIVAEYFKVRWPQGRLTGLRQAAVRGASSGRRLHHFCLILNDHA